MKKKNKETRQGWRGTDGRTGGASQKCRWSLRFRRSTRRLFRVSENGSVHTYPARTGDTNESHPISHHVPQTPIALQAWRVEIEQTQQRRLEGKRLSSRMLPTWYILVFFRFFTLVLSSSNRGVSPSMAFWTSRGRRYLQISPPRDCLHSSSHIGKVRTPFASRFTSS